MCDHHNCQGQGHTHGSQQGEEYSLFKTIDTNGLVCLNESSNRAVLNVFKPYDNKLDRTKFLESNDDDPQLIIFIPFTGVVKLKGITLIGGEEGSSPSKLKVWVNREDIDFSLADTVKPIQEWDLVEDPTGEVTYQTNIVKFQNVSNVTFYIPANFGSMITKILYIGLKGEYTAIKREAVKTVYELKPTPEKFSLEKNNFSLVG
eukprot:TRINITY_DN3390_c0_g1_i1.p1 TRINITY_DN3390_c0_g1~~TRINITY_DN3390_c0_g1_i1.p1  ORF type:complete len:204 (+),score=39.70 TRINITY_DN3390_c0_g1_i1:48-659(+)